MDTTDFSELVRNVNNNKIMLPDFQRSFVWTEEEKQKKLVASVLAKMPIGSILLLESDPKEYACMKIGCNIPVDSKNLSKTVHFLLDGQQRITVLSNVFSNAVQYSISKVSELSSESLKRRFFLRIPKWKDIWEEKNMADLFGIKRLLFSMENPSSDNPDFLSTDIIDYIEVIPFTAQDGKPYNPKAELTVDLDHFCVSYENGYLVPLFLAIGIGSSSRKSSIELRYQTIIEQIGTQIGYEIISYCIEKNDADKHAFMEQFLNDIDDIHELRVKEYDDEYFKETVINRAKVWEIRLKDYIESCLKNMILNEVIVEEQDRKRAIDIYENMNIGGVKLSVFDLVMARVAIVSKEKYLYRIIKYMENRDKVDYPLYVIPDELESIVKQCINDTKYNASVNAQCCIKDGLNPKYIDVFLDVLSLICNNPEYSPSVYNIQLIKKDRILSLKPEMINENTERVIQSIDRALYFLQTRCGIRRINDINYSLMLVLLAVIFSKDNWYYSKDVHKIIEGWYWSALFSGEFDKDQNAVFIKNLQALIRTINGEQDKKWILLMGDNILEANNFSDKRLLLMEKVKDEDRWPKQIIRSFMCQYTLSRPYADMIDDTKIISVFSPDAGDLEAHHIIPLGSCTSIGESTKALRSDNSHICNSPLNFVYITKESNNAISDDSLDVYAKKISNTAKSSLFISDYSTEKDPKEILGARYSNLQGSIKNRVKLLLQ